MNTIPLGDTGLKVSAVGFGGIPITRLPPDEAAGLIRRALEGGVNFIDTAYSYPGSEERIGLAVRGLPRERFVIASKDASRDGAMFARHVDESLQRLGQAWLDVMQLHNVSDRATWDDVRAARGALPALLRLRDRGLVRHVGVTCHNAELAAELVETRLFETVQVPFNFIADEATELVARCVEKGIGFIGMKPFAGGAIEDAVLALGFLQEYPSAVPIPGIETRAELEQVLELYERPGPLTDGQRRRIAELKKELGKVFCHACGYCQPCPQGVAIEMVLRARSFARRLPAERAERVLSRAMAKVDDCTECGQCLTKCPYHLEIPSMLRASRRWFDKWLKTLPR